MSVCLRVCMRMCMRLCLHSLASCCDSVCRFGGPVNLGSGVRHTQVLAPRIIDASEVVGPDELRELAGRQV